MSVQTQPAPARGELSLAPSIRPAVAADIPALEELMAESVRGLNIGDYTAAQVEAALASLIGVDRLLLTDGTYYVAEVGGAIVGCGGWSPRPALHGREQRPSALLDPRLDAAAIRAFYVRPPWARRGIGSALLAHCEAAALAAGFRRLELVATRTGAPLYARHGFQAVREVAMEVPGAPSIAGLYMVKRIYPRLIQAEGGMK